MSRGRPRSEQVDRKLALAALEEFTERGYAGMSIDAVAERAGVSKTTIYRRFQDKADLVTAAIASQPVDHPEPTAQNTRERLVEALDAKRRQMIDGGKIRVMAQILAESERNPKLIALHRERTIAARREEGKAILEAGVSSGELRPDVDFDLVLDILTGVWMCRYMTGEAFQTGWAEAVVDSIWPSIAAE